MPRMIVSIEGVVIKEIALAKDRTTLGRRPYNDIVIDNLAISGEHAVFIMNGPEVYLEDLNSTNGTYINARAIKKQVLHNNDLIEVGKYKIRYLEGGVASEGASAARHVLPPIASAPVPLATAPTAPMPLGGAPSHALIKVLSGPGAGREVTLNKVVTTIGKPGIAVAAITRRLQGYVVAPVDGATLLNGQPLTDKAVALQDGDMLELATTRMQFVQE